MHSIVPIIRLSAQLSLSDNKLPNDCMIPLVLDMDFQYVTLPEMRICLKV